MLIIMTRPRKLCILFFLCVQIISGLQNLDRNNVASVVTAADKVNE